MHAVGGNCDWQYRYNGSGDNFEMYGTIRVDEWKLRLGFKGTTLLRLGRRITDNCNFSYKINESLF